MKGKITNKEIKYWNCAGDEVTDYYLVIKVSEKTYKKCKYKDTVKIKLKKFASRSIDNKD